MGVSVNSKEYSVFGRKAVVTADLALSGTYTNGGLSINTDQLFGIHDVDMGLFEPQNGVSFIFDVTNDKIKIFAPAQPIQYEEHSVLDSSYQYQTKYPAAFFMNVAGVGENIKFRSTGIAKASLTAGECCLAAQMAAGSLTTLTVSPINQVTDAYSAIGVGTGWTAGTDWSFAGNKAVKAAGAGSGTLTLDETFPLAGHTYRVTYTVSATTAEGFTMSIGGTSGTAVAGDGTYTEDILAITSAGKLTFTPTTDLSAFSLDDIFVYDLDVYTTYVTQAWKDVWDNVIQDEALTLATGANNLASGNKILACMYIDQTTATAAALTMIDSDDTAASGEIDLLFNSATAQLTAHADQNAKAVKTTYVKVPTSGFLFDRLFTNETTTKEGVDPYRNILAKPLLLWGYTGQYPVNGQTTQRLIDWTSTPAAGQATIDWFNPSIRGHASTPTGAGAEHNHAGAVGGTTAAGASHNHTFTGTTPLSALDLAAPVFSGTGLTAAGQVMTTTDNQTMTVNQCAGMWLIPITGASAPMLILSNTAVTGAPAVFTVQGIASTDAGTYKVVTSLAPVGTNTAEATHTHAATGLTSTNTAESAHTHVISKSTAIGSIIDLKSNLTGTAAGVWGSTDEIVTIPLELDEVDVSLFTSLKVIFIGS